MPKDAIAERRMAMVTIGTDGFVDYVQVPDGQRFMLGPVSVLRLVASLVPGRTAKKALNEFLTNKQVMLSVDLDRMWSLLPFQRARFSSVGMTEGTPIARFVETSTNPLMRTKDRTQPLFERERYMANSPQEVFESRLARLEEQVTVFERHAKTASVIVPAGMAEARVASLKNLISDLRTAGLPPEFLEQQKKMKDKAKGDDDKDDDKKEASFDVFAANMSMAESIVAKVAAVDDVIDRLVQAGKRFDSVRAKTDLHKIASRVTEIAQSVDLGYPWVGRDLSALSRQANEIHGLFVPAQGKDI